MSAVERPGDIAYRIARCVRGCATDDQFIELIEGIEAEITRLSSSRAEVVEECARICDEVHRTNLHSVGISLASDARAMTAFKLAERIRALSKGKEE